MTHTSILKLNYFKNKTTQGELFHIKILTQLLFHAIIV